jgi:hypothetical protein
MHTSQEMQFDIKKIGVANWECPDRTTELWREITFAAKTNDDWLAFFSSPILSSNVPENLVKLFEVARGAMIYSWYFYPLATLGAEQCFRLLDTGTRIRCKQVGLPIKVKNKKGKEIDTRFAENVESLMKKGIISKTDKAHWDASRALRNFSSHPNRQTIFDPGQAQNILKLAGDFLNTLFA